MFFAPWRIPPAPWVHLQLVDVLLPHRYDAVVRSLGVQVRGPTVPPTPPGPPRGWRRPAASELAPRGASEHPQLPLGSLHR